MPKMLFPHPNTKNRFLFTFFSKDGFKALDGVLLFNRACQSESLRIYSDLYRKLKSG